MGTFRMVCSKCGQVVTSPPMGGDCPKGGNHAWTQAQFNQQKIKSIKKVKIVKELELA
jgi:DNA polymerase II large subunit